MAEIAEIAEPLDAVAADRPDGDIPPGTRVEVRKRFDATWARGFEVVDLTQGGYRLRRLSDGTELPAEFAGEDVRQEKKLGHDMWWY